MVMLTRETKKLTSTPVRFLIEEACLVFPQNEEKPYPAAVGDELMLPQDQAHQLAGMGRGFFLDSNDDITSGKLFTALQPDKDRGACKMQQAEIGRQEREARRAAAAAAAAPMSVENIAVAIAGAVAKALGDRKPQGGLL